MTSSEYLPDEKTDKLLPAIPVTIQFFGHKYLPSIVLSILSLISSQRRQFNGYNYNRVVIWNDAAVCLQKIPRRSSQATKPLHESVCVSMIIALPIPTILRNFLGELPKERQSVADIEAQAKHQKGYYQIL
ncbi:MAG: hypothetical protein AVO38_14025 [delta proteobacterium ML8_D]|nr:MAG: hypothetical protein AVO38_14025 [delta proteobacterium ML8_D]